MPSSSLGFTTISLLLSLLFSWNETRKPAKRAGDAKRAVPSPPAFLANDMEWCDQSADSLTAGQPISLYIIM